MEPINYFKEYLHSKLHLYIGVGCLLAALFTGHLLVLLLALAVYGGCMAFIYELAFFKNKVDAKYAGIQKTEDDQKMVAFRSNRDRQVLALTKSRQIKYAELSAICQSIEKTTMEQVGTADAASDARNRKLEELLYTYLKLLSIEQSLEQFIEGSRDENVAKEIDDAKDSLDDVNKAIVALQADKDGNPENVIAKQRLQASYADRLEVLKKRLNKVDLAKSNIELVTAEQSRLNDQVRLIRDDSLSSRNADSLSDRITDATANLEHTNDWLAQMSEFKDVVGDMPPTTARMGFEVPSQTATSEDEANEQEMTPIARKIKIKMSRYTT